MSVFTSEQIENEIRKEINSIVETAKKSSEKVYLDYHYPQLLECYYILVRFNIIGYNESEDEFSKLNKEILLHIRGKEHE